MSVSASPLVATETAPAPGDLWRPPALFLHDWSTPLVVRTSWTTQIATVRSAGETRAGLASRPGRSIDLTLLAMEQAEAALLRSWLGRMAMARTAVPLFCDQSLVTAGAAIGATTVACSTAARRFFAGGYAAIWPAGRRSMTASFDLVRISAVHAESLDLADALTHAYAAGDLVAPAIEGDLAPGMTASYLTDQHLRVKATLRESIGPMTLEPAAVPGSVPAGVASYQDLPVFAIGAHWGGGSGEGGAVRANEQTRIGLANYVEVHGSRFKASQAMEALQLDRAAAWALMGFFDSRGGRQKPFLAANLTSDFAASGGLGSIGSGAGTIALVAQCPLRDWDYRDYLALELADGSLIVRQVASVSRDAGVDTVTLEDALPAIASPVVRIAAAFKARFDSDEISESWLSDQAVRATLPQLEVMREMDSGSDVELDPEPGSPSAGGLGGSGAGLAPTADTQEIAFVIEDAAEAGPLYTCGGGVSAPFGDATVTVHGDVFFKSYEETVPAFDTGPGTWLFQLYAHGSGTISLDFAYRDGFTPGANLLRPVHRLAAHLCRRRRAVVPHHAQRRDGDAGVRDGPGDGGADALLERDHRRQDRLLRLDGQRVWRVARVCAAAGFPGGGLSMSMDAKAEISLATLLTFRTGAGMATIARYTSCLGGLTISGESFAAEPSIEVTMGRQQGGSKDVPVQVRMVMRPPLDTLTSQRAHAPVRVDIEEVDPTDLSTRRKLFAGMVRTSDRNPEGKTGIVEIEIAGWRQSLEIQANAWHATTTCNNVLGDAICAINLAEWRETAEVTAVDGSELTLSGLSVSGTGYWRFGYVAIDGLAIKVRDDGLGSGRLTLLKPPPASWEGQTVTVTPGCDLRLATCRSKFQNERRFTGFGFKIPAYNPFLESH